MPKSQEYGFGQPMFTSNRKNMQIIGHRWDKEKVEIDSNIYVLVEKSKIQEKCTFTNSRHIRLDKFGQLDSSVWIRCAHLED